MSRFVLLVVIRPKPVRPLIYPERAENLGLCVELVAAMRIRRIAILIDGGFFLKRLPGLVEPKFRDSPEAVANSARFLCKRHVQRLVDEPSATENSRWLDHVYRLFYYDAAPYDGVSHHPVLNRRIAFGETREARFRRELFAGLRRQRKFALRLGRVAKESGWRISPDLTKSLLRAPEWLAVLEGWLQQSELSGLPDDRRSQLVKLVTTWRDAGESGVTFGMRQKGVDMRIGLDIASMTLKGQIDTAVLVSGDSDFVPAAKLARREGVEFILDPMWQKVSEELFEHIDGLFSPFQRNAYGEDRGIV